MREPTNQFGSVLGSPTTEVFIVGGGPSLSGFPLHRLAGSTVFCVNDSVLSIPWAYAVVSADAIWVRNRSNILSRLRCLKYLIASEPGSEQGIWLEKVRAPALSGVQSAIHVGGTSGYAALNVAFLAGAKTIHLLGFDYHSPGSHWYGHYPWKSAADEGLWKLWAQAFTTTTQQLATANVNVYNYSQESAITAFETRSWRELLSRI